MPAGFADALLGTELGSTIARRPAPRQSLRVGMWAALLVVSLLVQLTAAWQALRLVRVTRHRTAWMLISAAVLLMSVRRAVTLVDITVGSHTLLDRHSELIALGISLLMLGGISLIGPLFRSIERSRQELAASEQRYAALIRDSPDAVVIITQDGTVEAFNPEATRITALSASEVRGRPLAAAGFLEDEQRQKLQREVAEARQHRRAGPIELDISRPDGAVIAVEANLQRVEGEPVRIHVTMRDVSERRRAQQTSAALEQQLQQARRLEALGQLAGGVAHDFNNLLTVILSSCEMVLHSRDTPHKLRADLQASCDAARRAANLTRQLLAFGRRQVLQTRELNLNDTVIALEELLSHVSGDIQLDVKCEAEHAKVYADPTQLDQVILNLVANARDAMPEGGVLTIRTKNEELDAEQARARGLAPGRYVALSLTDTGVGMDAETRQRIFEPFFTTKQLGQGEGLGLATVHGIVKQSSGDVDVDSAPGRGTTFRVLLPCAADDPPRSGVDSSRIPA